MLHASNRWGLLAAVVLAVVVPLSIGCADGSGDEALEADTLQSAPASADGAGTKLPPSPKDAAAPSADAGRDAAGDAGGSSTCGSTSTCSAALDLGSVAGDVGGEVKTQQGSGSRWFTLLVREDSLTSSPLRLRGELTSPPGANYDLFLYTSADSSTAVECSKVGASSTSTGAADSAHLELTDYTGIDDQQLVTVEVRHVSGPCDPTAKWTLTLTGNAL